MMKSKKNKKTNKKKEKVLIPEREIVKSRRDFLKTAWKGLGIIAGIEFAGLTFHFISDRAEDDSVEKLFDAGLASQFQINSVTAFRSGRFYLARGDDGGFLALSLKCSHLGCSIIWDEKENEFVCPCHSSRFSTIGEVINPPAPRPLDIYMISIENGNIFIDLNKKIKRDKFEKIQLAYA